MFETPHQKRHSLKILPCLKSSPSSPAHVAGPPTKAKLPTWAWLGFPDLKGHLGPVDEIQVPLVTDYNSGAHAWQELGSSLSRQELILCL